MVSCAPFHFKVAIILTAVVTMIILIVMCVVYVDPYNRTKHFEESVCTVKSHYVKIIKDQECNCYTTSGSSSDYETYCDYGDFECLKVFVTFPDLRGKNRTAMLYASDSVLANDKQCTYPFCDTYDESYVYIGPSLYVEDREYARFRDTYTKPGTSFDCHYNPDKGEAVIERNVSKKQAMSSTLGTLGTGVIIILILVLAMFICRPNRNQTCI